MSKTTFTVLSIIGAFVISLAGHLGFAQAFYVTTHWKTVPGQIIDCSERPTSDAAPAQSTVKYAFALDGRTYQNSGLRPLRWFMGPQAILTGAALTQLILGKAYWCKDVVMVEYSETPEYVRARYPLGKAVTVYYNPANPNSSVLELFRDPSEFWRMYFPGGHFWYKG
jgi:hypothetical protein